MEVLEANLEARASVAGVALKAVQQANEYERNQFLTQASIQREQLHASIAWDFRKVYGNTIDENLITHFVNDRFLTNISQFN